MHRDDRSDTEVAPKVLDTYKIILFFKATETWEDILTRELKKNSMV